MTSTQDHRVSGELKPDAGDLIALADFRVGDQVEVTDLCPYGGDWLRTELTVIGIGWNSHTRKTDITILHDGDQTTDGFEAKHLRVVKRAPVVEAHGQRRPSPSVDAGALEKAATELCARAGTHPRTYFAGLSEDAQKYWRNIAQGTIDAYLASLPAQVEPVASGSYEDFEQHALQYAMRCLKSGARLSNTDHADMHIRYARELYEEAGVPFPFALPQTQPSNAEREALERLGSMEAFTGSRAIDKDRDAELLARIDYARAALSNLPKGKDEGREADASLVEDAERWRALMSSQRMHFMGCAGFELSGNEEIRKKNDITGIARKPGRNLHFGMEFWDIHAPVPPEESDSFERKILTFYVDELRKWLPLSALSQRARASGNNETTGNANYEFPDLAPSIPDTGEK